MRVAREVIERRLAEFKTRAQAAGVKLTHQRLEIFREVAASLEHPDAETVFRGVRKRLPTVSLDTVYRTLWTLHDLKLIATLGVRHESVRFDANLDRHHHYICVRCGMARDFQSPELEALSAPAEAREFGSVLDARIEVRGVCDRCNQKGSDKSGGSKRSRRKDKEEP